MKALRTPWPAVLASAALLATLPAAGADDPPPPGSRSKPAQSAKRGTDAAGRAIQKGDAAARRGIESGSERAAAGPRRWGESLGRKLGPGTAGQPAPPATGPQGNAP